MVKTLLRRAAPALVLLLAWAAAAQAMVTGPCSNCHTMHNSQGGQPMAYGFTGTGFAADSTPNPGLLVTDCIGCHSATDGSTWKDPTTGAPIVHNTAEPAYGATADGGMTHAGLAAGNFYWLVRGDSHGHNIFNGDATLSGAPGDASGCKNDSCHENFHLPYSGTGHLQGRTACEGCHMVSGVSEATVTTWHHAHDAGPAVNSAGQGWYRFLAGHKNGDGHGVSGVEDPDWEHAPTATAHNEYLGIDADKTSNDGFAGIGDTMTGFCAGCHGDFHVQDDTVTGQSAWLRHPSDAVLPSSGEYQGYTAYDPLVPVARPALGAVSGTVTPGQDMVMCLSCHRAHASPYPKLMRWDYGGADLQQALYGCGACHTQKR